MGESCISGGDLNDPVNIQPGLTLRLLCPDIVAEVPEAPVCSSLVTGAELAECAGKQNTVAAMESQIVPALGECGKLLFQCIDDGKEGLSGSGKLQELRFLSGWIRLP